MSKGAVSKANKEMAAYLKAKGIKRTTANCPMCHRLVSISQTENHIRTCRGRERKGT